MSYRSFFFGVLTGLAVGLLIAPKSGRKTREEMRKTYFDIKDRVMEDLKKIKNISKETYESVINSAVNGYEEARVITSREAAQIRDELRSGYNRIKGVFEIPEKS